MRTDRTQRGFTLIEALVVVALILSVLAVALSVANPTGSAVDGAQLARRISDLATAIRTQYSDRTNYTGLSNATLLASGAAPAELIDGFPQVLRTPDGTILVAPTNRDTIAGTGNENLAFLIQFTAPEGVCPDTVRYLSTDAVRLDAGIAATPFDIALQTTATARSAALAGLCRGTRPTTILATYR